jgi:hypothetical protein
MHMRAKTAVTNITYGRRSRQQQCLPKGIGSAAVAIKSLERAITRIDATQDMRGNPTKVTPDHRMGPSLRFVSTISSIHFVLNYCLSTPYCGLGSIKSVTSL